MKKLVILGAIAIGAAMLLSMNAEAQGKRGPGPGDPGQMAERIFKAADKDASGTLSLEEFTQALAHMRQRTGRGGPGAGQGPGQRPGAGPRGGWGNEGPRRGPGGPDGPGANRGAHLLRMVKNADADADGKVTLEELRKENPNVTEDHFKRMDRNGDGALSAADTAAPARHRQRPAANPRGAKPGDGKRPALKELLKVGDKDGDGKLSLEEAKAVLPGLTEEKFNRRDRNGDGFLGPDDRKKKPASDG